MFNTLTRMGSSGVTDAYEIGKSLRFNTHDSARLDRAISSAGDVQRWTFSCWFKRAGLDTDDAIWFQGNAGAYRAGLQLSSHRVSFIDTGPYGSGGTTLDRTSARVLRDPTRWYHVLIQLDSTNATAQDRCKMYLDGELQVGDLLAVNTTFAQSTNGIINSTTSGMRFGANPYNTAYSKADLYLAEVHFINGANVSINTFGETNAKGNWVPKEVTGVTYGTNGFYLDFSDNSGTTATTLGKDSSGNGNNFTPSNFSVTAGKTNDSLTDTPTSNYCTLNPLNTGQSIDPTDGNLKFDWNTHGNLHEIACGTFGFKSGSWYWEMQIESGYMSDSIGVGIIRDDQDVNNSGSGPVASPTSFEAYGYRNDANKLTKAGGAQSFGATWTSTSDVIGVHVDFTGGTGSITFYKNNSSQGTISSIPLNNHWLPWIGGYGSYSGNQSKMFINFGQRDFAYTPPAGAKALTIQNLPEPTIADPTAYFNTVLYTGNGGSQSVTGVGFQPDLLWIKNRTQTDNHQLHDAVRGPSKGLHSNLTDNEFTDTNAITSFDSDGFSMNNNYDSHNKSSETYVASNWKESATAGFDIVSYSGNGSAGNTVSHSLGVAPDLMIIKNRTTDGPHWFCYMRSMGNTTWIPLDVASLANTSVTDTLNSTSPTSSIFTLGNNNKVNASSTDYIAYLWAAVEGYSKFWFYTGNGNADGPFVYTGFKPAFMIACNTATENYWRMWNNKSAPINPVATGLYPNDTAVEDAPVNWTVDWLSNGFKVRNDDGEMNGDGQDIIYWAWAEEPFKYSTAR